MDTGFQSGDIERHGLRAVVLVVAWIAPHLHSQRLNGEIFPTKAIRPFIQNIRVENVLRYLKPMSNWKNKLYFETTHTFSGST